MFFLILCQKPMTPTLAESEALLADIGKKVRFMVHENWRFRPQYRQAAAWMAQGRTGPIQQFSLEETLSLDLADAYQKSYDGAIAHFVECLRSGQPFETDCSDNLATLRLVEDAYRQAAL